MSKLKSVLFFLWHYKWVWIGILPLPIFYFGFHKHYFFLGHNNDWQILVEYASLELIPALTILGSMFLFKVGIDKGIAVVSSMLINSWYLYNIVPIWSVHFFKLLTKKGIGLISLYEQWSLIMQMNGFWGYLISDVIQLILIISAFWFLVRNRSLIKFDWAFSSAKPKSTNFGTAKFLDVKGIKKLIHSNGIVIGAIPKDTDFNNPHKVISSIKKKGGNEIVKIKANHTTVIAPTRSGKGAGIIIPTLLEYEGPVFVTDIKGENYCITKRAREAKGRKVYAFDPCGITGYATVKINPLSFLRNDKSIVDNCKAIANILCPDEPQDSGNTGHFKQKSRELLTCFILYVVCSEEFKVNEKNLYKVYKTLATGDDDSVKNTLKKVAALPESFSYGAAQTLASSILKKCTEEYSGIFSTAEAKLSFIDSPYLKEATCGSDICLSDITSGNIDLFFCIPPSYIKSQPQLLRLFIGMVLMGAENANGRIGKYDLLMLLDELPELGHLDQVEHALALSAGYGISVMAISQTIGLLKKAYPITWETFFTNQLSVFFGCGDPATAEEIAKKLGKKTIKTTSESENESLQTNQGRLNSSFSSGTGKSTSETGRDLLTPAEIQRLGNKIILAFYSEEDPILCARVNYWQRNEWKGKWDPNPLLENRGVE